MLAIKIEVSHVKHMGFQELIKFDKEIKCATDGEVGLISSLKETIKETKCETELKILKKVLNSYEFIVSLYENKGG